MSVSISDGPAIVAGYEYRLQLEADSPVFPAGCTLTAHLRAKVSDSTIIATLTTANGGLTRIADTVVEITIPSTATAGLPLGSVVMDMVRTDLEPDRHLNFALEIPVVRPVTRGL
jgi:hypothetical protein